MDKVLETIKKYLLRANTDYAIMLKAEWGYGKTYYIKKSIKEDIEKIINPSTGNRYKMIHISLSGIQNSKEIYNLIIGEKYKLVNTKTGNGISGFVNSVADFFGISLKENFILSDYLDYRDNIICFDDLERISSKLNLEDVLGFINSNFTEHNKIKTIIIANENQIEKSLVRQEDKKVDDAEKSVYSIIKEKFIFRTIKYTPNIEDVLLSSVQQIANKKIQQKLLDNLDFLSEIINLSNSKNIRTLHFVIDNLQIILNALTDELFNQSIEEILLFTTSICYEYKKGEFSKNKKITPQNIQNINANFLALRSLGKIEKTFKAPERTYKDEFYEKYLIDKFQLYHFFQSIFDLVTTGFLDKNLLIREFQELITPVHVEELKEENILYNQIIHFRDLSNEEFDKTTKHILGLIKEGVYSPYVLPELLMFFLHFKEKKLLSYKEKTVLRKFYFGLKKAKEIHTYNKVLHDRISLSDIKHPEVINLYKEVGKFHKAKQALVEKKQAKELFKNIEKIDTHGLRDLFNNISSFQPILKDLKISTFFKFLMELPNEKLHRLVTIFQTKYLDASPRDVADFLSQDIPKLNELNIKLAKHLKRYKTNNVQRYHLSDLKSIIDRVLKIHE